MVKDGCVLAQGAYETLLWDCPDFRKLMGDEYEDNTEA